MCICSMGTVYAGDACACVYQRCDAGDAARWVNTKEGRDEPSPLDGPVLCHCPVYLALLQHYVMMT